MRKPCRACRPCQGFRWSTEANVRITHHDLIDEQTQVCFAERGVTVAHHAAKCRRERAEFFARDLRAPGLSSAIQQSHPFASRLTRKPGAIEAFLQARIVHVYQAALDQRQQPIDPALDLSEGAPRLGKLRAAVRISSR
jgi:hypothetical protein